MSGEAMHSLHSLYNEMTTRPKYEYCNWVLKQNESIRSHVCKMTKKVIVHVGGEN